MNHSITIPKSIRLTQKKGEDVQTFYKSLRSGDHLEKISRRFAPRGKGKEKSA
jgi:hypothetical protein